MDMLVVESKAKAKTIQKYLGNELIVLATGGHVQELPDRHQDQKEGKKAFWANRPGELPTPPWAWTENGEKAVRAIREAAERRGVKHFFLASDPDREGEFIAWRLSELLSGLGACHRVIFQEVTATAVRAAIAKPRGLDMKLVESAMVRRFLDRLVGFRTSKTARQFVAGGTASMGRVQTPTLGFVVERELEREAHVPIPYFEVIAAVDGTDFHVRFHRTDDPTRWVDESAVLAERCRAALQASPLLSVSEAKTSERTEQPRPAFTTDALLQAAGSRWGWTPKKTSKLASDLYEAGHITYIRTDSTRLSDDAVREARAVLKEQFGQEYLGEGAAAVTSVGRVQDAHEAIRPTHIAIAALDGIEQDAQRLYALIRAQMLASQMAPARRATLSVTAIAQSLDRPLTGAVSWYVQLGWRAAFREFDEPEAPPTRVEATAGERLPLLRSTNDKPNPCLRRGETKPLPRYRAHALVKAMKDEGIGRPSTYASTIETLLERRYIVERDGALAPTSNGRSVWLKAVPLYVLRDGQPMLDVAYTAAMENHLDDIERGEEPAPRVWETLRDEVRDAHNAARKKRRTGQATPRQCWLLEALLANAPEARSEVGAVDGLTAEQATAWVARLRGRGVLPAPSKQQLAEIERLLKLIGLSLAEAGALAGLEGFTSVRTQGEASAIIDALRGRLPEVTAPSEKQHHYVADLAKKVGLTEAEACGRVGVHRFDQGRRLRPRGPRGA